MRAFIYRSTFTALLIVAGWATMAAQDLSFRDMRWRDIGPTRAGRARAAAGVASQPNTFYAGFDNGGVWRSTDYGSNWVPIFDTESTGSIGAIAVAPSNPSVIYVGSGEANVRNSVSFGNGVYKSTDGGKTWKHLGLSDTRHISRIVINPRDPKKVYVAAIGHSYGPNESSTPTTGTAPPTSTSIPRTRTSSTRGCGTLIASSGPSAPATRTAACTARPTVASPGRR